MTLAVSGRTKSTRRTTHTGRPADPNAPPVPTRATGENDGDNGKLLPERVPQWRRIFTSVVRGLLIVALIRLGRAAYRTFFLADRTPANAADSFRCAWRLGEPADLHVYLSSQPIQVKFRDEAELLLSRTDLRFAPDAFEISERVSVDLRQFNVGDRPGQKDRLFAHVYLCRSGAHPDPDRSAGGFRPLDVVYRRVALVGVESGGAAAQTVNLLSSRDKTDRGPARHAEGGNAKDSMLYWYPELRLRLVTDDRPMPSTVSPTARPFMTVDWKTRQYLPIMYSFEQWRLRSKRLPLSASGDGSEASGRMHLDIRLDTGSHWAFTWLAAGGEAFDRGARENTALAGDFEQLKELFIETTPWLLIVTLLVSVLHMLFDFLAFREDVKFWRNRRREEDNFEGISLRSLLIGIACQFVILLYLVEQSSSWIVIGSALVGLSIELWKTTRVLEFDPRSSWLPRPRKSYRESATEQYDGQAIRYLTIGVVPLVIVYSVYSLVYNEHRSWTAYLLNTAVGFVYAFGFVLMTPQLFINYKLKSVAHMPWRSFCYKALNTFVDDLFAFVIKMPTLHRVACFRDDLLFLVYLYQRWIYPVDKTRRNEFGQLFVEEEKDKTGDGKKKRE